MLLVLAIAANAAEVRLKTEAGALGALLWPVGLVLFVSMLAHAARSPRIHIEALAPRQPPLADFFGTPRNEPEAFAIAVLAACLSFFADYFLVVLEQMATEAAGHGANAEAVVRSLLGAPGYVDPALLGFLGMVELPGEHLLGSRRWADLLDALEDRAHVVRLS